jgi:hypothetical protein
MRRSAMALEELRSCCRTADAERSFEDFAQEIDAKYDQITAAEGQVSFHSHPVESKARLFAAGLRPKVLGVDRNIAAATLKMMNTERKPRPSMTKSKTMGDITQVTKATAKEAKIGWRRTSYLKAQEEVLASEMELSAERRARVAAAAQRTARRSGIGGNVVTSSGTTTQSEMLPPAMKPAVRHSLPRKSSGTGPVMGTNAEMLKRVFSESVRSVKRMGRSFTGMSGSGDA